MQATLIFQQIVNGLAIGSVYAIFALGYTLVFSILGIINFAHGAVFTLGAYGQVTASGGAVAPKRSLGRRGTRPFRSGAGGPR